MVMARAFHLVAIAIRTLVIAGCFIGLAGCGSTTTSGVLRLAVTPWPSFDPARAEGSAAWVDSLLYSGLVKFDPSLHVVPDLAVALPTVSADGRTYIFTIRDDISFADGRPVRASDFVYSFTRALSPALDSPPARAVLGTIQGAVAVERGRAKILVGVRALGLHRLQIQLYHADPAFLDRLALPPAAVLDPYVVTRYHDWWLHGPGAGPFALIHVGNPTILHPNPHYYDGPLRLRSLALFPVGDQSEGYRLYQQHRVDVAAVPLHDFVRAAKESDFSSVDTLTAYYLVVRHEPEMVRVAMDEALNRSELSRPNSYLDPSSTIVPPIVPDYRAYPDPHQYDPPQAHAALAQLRVHTIRLEADGASRAIVAWLRRSWQRVGLRTEVRGRAADVQLISVNSALPDAQTWLIALTAVIPITDRHLYARLLREAVNVKAYPDPLTQMGFDNRAEEYVLSRALVIPIAVIKQGYVIENRVHGLIATPYGLEPQSESWTTVTTS
jgi:ABC-type oligopeptide transport system substrate-binding subunit